MTLFDPGLQPERTELAWRRTALSLAVGSLVAMRLLPAVLGSVAWIAFGILGLIVAAIIWLAARRRYRLTNDALQHDEAAATVPDGRLLLVAAALTAAFGAASLVVVIGASR